MPTRTLPTRDVTLADGRRLYYQQGESRQYAASGKQASVYMTKRGPDGALRILVTVDDEPERGEHYHLSASYPDFTPTPDEMLAVVAALLPGGQYGAMTPESHPQQALHGHVVHLIEEPPAYAARRADIPPRPEDLYIDSSARPGVHALHGAEPQHADRATLLRAVREELGLAPPFTTDAFRAALDHLRGRRGLAPGALPLSGCATKDEAGKHYVIPVPAYAALVEREHATLHGLAHLIAKHAPLAAGIYTADQEREAEDAADALFTFMICGDAQGGTDSKDVNHAIP